MSKPTTYQPSLEADNRAEMTVLMAERPRASAGRVAEINELLNELIEERSRARKVCRECGACGWCLPVVNPNRK